MSSNKKARKKLSSKNEDLKKTLAGVRSELTKAEKALARSQKKADRWKTEAIAQRRSAARSGAKVEKLRRKLDRASTALEPSRAATPTESSVSGLPAGQSTSDGVTVPDESWSVVQLRAEARSRGITGVSNKPKVQLLAALR